MTEWAALAAEVNRVERRIREDAHEEAVAQVAQRYSISPSVLHNKTWPYRVRDEES